MALYSPSSPSDTDLLNLPSPARRSQPSNTPEPYTSPPPKRDPWYPRHWPHGVVHGGTLLDMTDTLRNDPSRTGTDQALSLWLEGTYLLPFRTVERLHGLVVRDEEDMETLVQAYKRHARFHILPDGAPPAGLFVPGLEPLHAPKGDQMEIPQIPDAMLVGGAKRVEHYKSGIDRGGKLVAILNDDRAWEREIWRHPLLKNDARQIKTKNDDEFETLMQIDVSKPCQAPGCCERHDEQDVTGHGHNDSDLNETGDGEEEEEDREDTNFVSRPGLTLDVRDVLLALKTKLARELKDEPTDDESMASLLDS